jgi:hypothetical protein
MQRERGRRAQHAAEFVVGLPALLIATTLALGGCNTGSSTGIAAAQPRGASVAFESIDGLPQRQFTKLVHDLNDEAQSRRLAVLPRGESAAYRVRGYLAAELDQDRTTVSWVWDVFDRDQRRALRISGSESAKVASGWQVADDAMLQRIARSSMEQLAAFLTSPAVAPGTTDVAGPQIAFAQPSASSPEAAGIYRIFRAHADPISETPAEITPASDRTTPLPRHRPADEVAAGEIMTLAAAGR